jgi:hypothetical protein
MTATAVWIIVALAAFGAVGYHMWKHWDDDERLRAAPAAAAVAAERLALSKLVSVRAAYEELLRRLDVLRVEVTQLMEGGENVTGTTSRACKSGR